MIAATRAGFAVCQRPQWQAGTMHTAYASVSYPVKKALLGGSALHTPFSFGPGRQSPVGAGMADKGCHLEALRFRSQVI